MLNETNMLMNLKLGSVVDRIGMGMLFINEDRKIIFANRYFCKLINTTLAKLKGKPCWMVMHPEAPHCLQCEKSTCCYRQLPDRRQTHHVLCTNSHLDNYFMHTVYDINEIMKQQDVLNRKVEQLQNIVAGAVGNRDLIYICCDCRRIKMVDGAWIHPKNVDILMQTQVLSHGYCPKCAQKYLEKFEGDKK